LRAAREVDIDDLVERHDYVEVIVERFGGFYDGGEATYQVDDDTAAMLVEERPGADLDDLLAVLDHPDGTSVPVWDIAAPESSPGDHPPAA
jgi:hypothetical protein